MEGFRGKRVCGAVAQTPVGFTRACITLVTNEGIATDDTLCERVSFQPTSLKGVHSLDA